MRLAREGALIDLHLCGFEQLTVGGDFIASSQQDEVADDNFAARNLRLAAISDDTNGIQVVLLVQERELPVCFLLEPESETGGQGDGYDNAHGLEERRGIRTKAKILIARNADGQDGRHEQNNNEGIGKLLSQLAPPGSPFAGSEDIGAMSLATGKDLSSCETSFRIFFFHFHHKSRLFH